MLKDKAAANLRAGEALLALGLVDPAAGRYYYALYQAAVDALTRQGLTPGMLQSGAIEWGHVMVMNNVYLVRRRRADRTFFDSMRRLRVRADYSEASIDPASLATRLSDVRAFVVEAIQ